MVAYKAAQTPGILARPDTGTTSFLLYGPEAGLVLDRAASLARLLSQRNKPNAEIVRLDERDLADDPDRLTVEVQTISMFAGYKVVWVRIGAQFDVDLMIELIKGGHEAFLIVEASNLRPADKLRKLFESADGAAALPCYGDTARDVVPLIEAEVARRSASITPEAKSMIIALIGSDTALARSEIAKLVLFAGEGAQIDTRHVEAIIADNGDLALDHLAQATADKAADRALRQLDRLGAAGTSAQAGLAALVRHFERLHRVIVEIDAGTPSAHALAGVRPPLSFKQRDALTRHARAWRRGRIQRVIAKLQATIAETRRRPQLERQLTEQLILELCR